MEQVYIPKQNYKVLVRCFTYNQSKYIEDALNGFAMQKTDFPFACLVMDDASTDGEQEVIKAWMERECDMEKAENVEIEKSFVAIVPHKTNSSCTFAFYFLKENLYKKGGKMPMIAPWREHCEYEALCEGDDYWIDSQKLQKQINFMDSHSNYTVCFHNAIEHFENGTIPDRLFSSIEDRNYTGIELFERFIVPTASVIYKLDVVTTDFYKIALSNSKFVFGDNRLLLICAKLGKVRGMARCMSVYRRQENGLTQLMLRDFSLTNKVREQILEVPKVFGEEFAPSSNRLFFDSCCSSFCLSLFGKEEKIIGTESLKMAWKRSPKCTMLGIVKFFYVSIRNLWR